jgi:hypothetical protein
MFLNFPLFSTPWKVASSKNLKINHVNCTLLIFFDGSQIDLSHMFSERCHGSNKLKMGQLFFNKFLYLR